MEVAIPVGMWVRQMFSRMLYLLNIITWDEDQDRRPP